MLRIIAASPVLVVMMPATFRLGGLRVRYRGFSVPTGASSHMWGASVTLTDVAALPTR